MRKVGLFFYAPSHHHDFAWHHDVGGALDAVEERFATAGSNLDLAEADYMRYQRRLKPT